MILTVTGRNAEAEYLLKRVLDKISGLIDEQGNEFSLGRNEFPSGIRKITESELIEIAHLFPKGLVALMLMQANPLIHLTERAVCAVLRYQMGTVVTSMLNKRCSGILVTRAVLTAAVQNQSGLSSDVLLSLLARREDTTTEPLESVLVAAASEYACRAKSLKILLHYMRDSTAISQAMLIGAFRSGSHGVKERSFCSLPTPTC